MCKGDCLWCELCEESDVYVVDAQRGRTFIRDDGKEREHWMRENLIMARLLGKVLLLGRAAW